ncbi:MAG: VCBS repeat-containing protein, partial [Phycisphaerae bacterium]
ARAFDWNSDGLIDLIVGSGANIYLVKNVGTPTQPLFEFPPEPIRIAWGNAPLKLGHQVIDWNGDGLTDLVEGYTVHLNSGAPNPYRWEKKVSVLPKGAYIHHPSGIGDDHFWPYLHDLDRDGRIDVLFGDWYGNVWFHRNLSDGDETRFDLEGHHLLMVNGQPIKVGPLNGDIENDFVAHQGARTSLIAGDYDGDGLDDLIVGDTYGIVRYYRNAGPLEDPRFEEPITVGDVKFRLTVEKTDWDRDGRLDVIASADNHRVLLFRNIGAAGQAARFDAGIELDLPPIRGPSVRFADLNRDGDEDLIITGTQGTTLVERSFLGQGYAEARLLKLQRRASH